MEGKSELGPRSLADIACGGHRSGLVAWAMGVSVTAISKEAGVARRTPAARAGPPSLASALLPVFSVGQVMLTRLKSEENSCTSLIRRMRGWKYWSEHKPDALCMGSTQRRG